MLKIPLESLHVSVEDLGTPNISPEFKGADGIERQLLCLRDNLLTATLLRPCVINLSANISFKAIEFLSNLFTIIRPFGCQQLCNTVKAP